MKSTFYLAYLAFILSLTVVLCGSCRKFIEVQPPETKAELSKIFADDQTATSAAVGLYYRMASLTGGFCTGAITLYCGLCSDEMSNVTSGSYDAFKNNAILSNNTVIRNQFWTDPFRNIYQANAVLEGLEASATLSAGVKDRIKGEMLYARALHYFYLLNLFGPVPYQTVTDYQVNASMPRMATEKIYDQITADLLQSRALLSGSYPISDNLRPNKNAVTALLARIYLYRANWKAAAEMATEVINSGKYVLDDPANVFLATSKETIFQLYKQNANTPAASYFIPSSATVRPTFQVSAGLLNAFEAGDKRKATWLKSNTVSGIVYYYPFKYKNRALMPVTEYEIVQRFAELYLVRAEARANLNDLNGAIEDLDKIRSRAGISTIKSTRPNITKDEFITAVLKEYQTEYFTEWGHRWMELKRLGKADEVLGPIKGANWQPTDKLFPIPFSEIQTNPFLTQNDGYTN